MSRLIYSLLMIGLFLAACEEDKSVVNRFDGDMVISSGYICGWCAGADSLFLENGTYSYIAYGQCSPEAIVDKSGQVTQAQWEELLQGFDFDDFASIEINTCNVCVDGCDYWVEIKHGEEIYKISFGHSPQDSAAIAPILPFIEKLDELKAELTAE